MGNITVIKDGPYHITGVSDLKDSQGNVIEAGDEIWLCRCGQSGKKPFCDGAHKKVGFKDES